ncbi:DNA-binding transcriptional regulator, MarR family [Mucilaginibacter pineti]|uniref:DNA-binding transcriptional regulator, MarR family n=1 Tax=Mucilaginibacter pineti TaxID=1391627 RepID=A0A1G6ZQM7_9SPHI|nr:MarR family transcriptional regulator [Mucilaginibacter pineti]SDE04988.1 DNA-binding transcriptional regulator, MarR family [Mucilaginibacter pineti]
MESNKGTDRPDQERNIFRIFYVLKRALDEWGEHHLNLMHNPRFHITYMPFFMNIGLSGISNNELAMLMGVTKQAASRIVKELMASGYVRAEKNDIDQRSSMLYLTKAGEQFYIEVEQATKLLEQEYTKLIGVRNYDTTIDGLLKLIKFHESKPLK